jgi:hypothetical protein
VRVAAAVVVCGLCALAACSFDGASPAGDAPVTPGADAARLDDGAVPPPIDATPPDASGLCGGMVWFADFNGDPTQQDLNQDGVDDWAMRNDSAFPAGQLTGGTWLSPVSAPELDSRPSQPFLTRTIVDVRMRNTDTCCARGAVFWINVAIEDGGFVPLFVDVKLTGADSQTAKLVRKSASGADDQFAMISGLDGDFVDVHLDIDPVTPRVEYVVAGAGGSANLIRQNVAITDGWATLTAFSSESEFDEIRVEVCP